MLSGSVFWNILSFALPIMVGNFFLQLYVIVDAVIVGRFLGGGSLAAVSVASPMLFLVTYFLFGGCTGVSVLIAQNFGSGNEKGLKENLCTGLAFGTAFTLTLTVLCLMGAPSVLRWTKAPYELRGETMAYLKIVFSGLIFSFWYNYGASALRGIGNSRAPFVIQVAASCAHIAMNLLFVGALGFGVRGSAWATVLSQILSSSACVVWIYTREPILAVRRGECRVSTLALRNVIGYSWAAALQSIIVHIGRFLTQGCVNPLGAVTVAGYNAATRVENMTMMCYDGVGTALSTFVAQNVGAGHSERVRAGFWTALAMTAAYVIPAGIFLFLNAPAVMGLFVGDGGDEIVHAGTLYLRPMAFYLMIAAGDSMIQSTFRGFGNFRIVMLVSLTQIVVRVILSFRWVPTMGVPAIAHSTAVGWTVISVWLIWRLHGRLASLPDMERSAEA